MAETFRETIDFERLWNFHGFNHDMNCAHAVPHVVGLISLSLLGGRLDELGEKILSERKVISPGMMHLGLLEHRIPANMIVAEVSTRFKADPLFIPVSGHRIEIEGEKSEEPYVDGGEETHGVKYTFLLAAPNVFGDIVELQTTTVVAFPDNVPTDEIFMDFKRKFEKTTAKKGRGFVDSEGKSTDITREHDSFYWTSIRPYSLDAADALPITRGASISQLEMLAKLPRIFSIYMTRVDKDRPEYIMPVEPSDAHAAYAELEKAQGVVDDAWKRASELANMLKYIYSKQEAVFDPRIKCHIDDRFDLKTHLTRYKSGFYIFNSEMTLPSGCAYADRSTVLAAPLLPEDVMGFLLRNRIDIRTLEKFD